MPRPCLILLAIYLLLSVPASAQNLIESRRSSYYTFIYKINNEQARVLYKDIWDFDKSFLDSLFDFFPTDSIYRKELPTGHYAFIKTVDGSLHCELKSVDNLSMTILNNHRDLMLVFNDPQGRERRDVEVAVRSRRIPFHESVKAYRLRKSNKRGIVSAAYQGHVSFFQIDRRLNNTFFVRTGRRISRTFPINHLISPVFYVKEVVQRIAWGGSLMAPGIYHRIARIFKPKPRTGYVVLNKPKFKPYDTLLMKGVITTRKGRPLAKEVDIYLSQYYRDGFNKKIGSVTPFRKGAYQYVFPLTDSLNLKLDQNYSVEFRDRKGNTLVSTDFKYEEYLLKNNSYSVRSERKTKLRPATLYLKGEDSNELPLFDVRAEILVKPAQVGQYYRSNVFVPDTLWFYQTKLDPLGETKIAIPDSIMPPVALGYEVVVAFYNAENERTVKTLSLEHDTKPFPITITIENDSVKVSNLDPLNPIVDSVRLTRSGGLYDFSDRPISLPYSERVDPFTGWYSVSCTVDGESETDDFDVAQLPDKLQMLSNRTADSLFIVSENPRRIPFRYFLFRNGGLIESSHGESLNIRMKVKASDRYALSVQYVWAGKGETLDYELVFDKRNLDIRIDHPAVIYPGQKASFRIGVKDAFGAPVEDVDLTALAVTRKFETTSVPSVPSYAKPTRSRAVFNEFSTRESDLRVWKNIEWDYWKRILGLDSIAFYRLLFPDTGYCEYRTKAETSQFAPFIVRRGGVLPVQVIYVDDQPVYYEGVSTMEPYSFHIRPGVHTIAVRLNNRLVTIRRVSIEPNEKLIFSIDLNHLPSNCTETEMPFQFSDDELKRLSRYFMVLRSPARASHAFLQQGDVFRLIEAGNSHFGYPNHEQLVGPLYPGAATYSQKDGFRLGFTYEPFFSYEFQEGQLKLREAKTGNYLKKGFSWKTDIPSFKDQVRSLGSITQYWKDVDDNAPPVFKRFPDFEPGTKRIGRLTLDGLETPSRDRKVKATFIVELNNPDNYFIITEYVKNLPFYPGRYEAVVIYDNAQYLRADSVEIKLYGNNYYNLATYRLHEADTFSMGVLNTIKKWSTEEVYMMRERRQQLQKVRGLFYRESSSNYQFDHVVSGRIVAQEDGSPLPGVNVVVKGTSIGTVTDMDGNYRLGCPPNGTLVFSFIGFATHEVAVRSQRTLDVSLTADVQMLSEVVVTGLGVQTTRSNLAYSMTLAGRVAGVQMLPTPYSAPVESVLRGYASTTPDAQPLIILDGRIVRLQDVDKNTVTAMDVMEGSEATMLFGSRASNGVILLSTRPGARKEDLKEFSKSAVTASAWEVVPGNALRRNFKDYAFWKPSLRTDQDGYATFDATFPDDITGWNAHVLGVAGKLTGQTSSAIKSFKPLVAQIAQPLFLVANDSATALGKITNYSAEEINLNRTITLNGEEISRATFNVKDSRIDSIHLTAQDDSISVQYSVSYKDYSDGELRKIPVYPQGVQEATGYFIPFVTDSTATLSFKSASGKITLYAEADMLDVLLDEIRFLRDYPYECNEQQASRLIALLLERKIRAYRNERFKDEREISKIIRKLSGNQNADGSWSWWGSDGGSVWITLHAARSLDLALKEGFRVAVDKDALINYLEINLTNTSADNRLDIQAYLLEQGEKLQVKELTDSLHKSQTVSLHDKLSAQRLRQLSGATPDWGWINSQRSQTVKGNWYWGEDRSDLLDNSILNTLLVYKMLEQEDPSGKEIMRIRNYFLEQRKQNWRNTYEASLILEAILPGILAAKPSASGASLQLSGLVNEKIEEFPFRREVDAGELLTVSKTGQSPVYFTAYQQTWNSAPSRSEKNFVVTTYFEDSTRVLKSGKPVKLFVEVEVRNDARYVMIQVPIPAGCSYESKAQFRTNGETYREYYNHKTNIYCQFLKKGKYTYSVPLLPRYSGSYTLNPAVVECMYFPTIYGREGVKRVRVGDR